MYAFELGELGEQRRAAGRPFLEFLHVPALSIGLYVLPAGGADRQKTHTEDEVYYVTGGRAVITVGDEVRPVGPGSVIYVAARIPHRFNAITEDLTLLVFFAPAEYSQAND